MKFNIIFMEYTTKTKRRVKIHIFYLIIIL